MISIKINLKSFLKSLKKRFFKRVLNRKLLHKIGKEGVKHIQNAQMLTSKKGERIRKGVGYTVGLRTVTFYLDGGLGNRSAGHYQNYGVRRHQMKYLLKAKSPIPIIAKRNNPARGEKVGDLIFRWATQAGMSRGGWVHPGYSGKKFFEKGLENLRAEFMQKIQKDISKYVSNKF